MDTTFLRELSLLVRSPKKGIDEIFWFGTLEKGIKAGLAGWCATHMLGFALGIVLLPLVAAFGGFLLGFIPAVYGIFSILREVIGLGMYWFVGSFILWKLLSVLLDREFDFKQVLMGTAYIEGYTGALGLALILASIICIYLAPILMILLVPLGLAYVGAVIYVAVMLLSRLMNVEPLTVGAVYVVLFLINLLYNWIMRILFA
ncbi:hypothetical protein [uncultured Veillonella sp.]|uniref:hypothetical protein n=1 Tax=uncultured Veillonella sp. TaxID=159268 RepID=UPI0025995A24|nr:hypothetical protein [uncultured Veillonella sp.]